MASKNTPQSGTGNDSMVEKSGSSTIK